MPFSGRRKESFVASISSRVVASRGTTRHIAERGIKM